MHPSLLAEELAARELLDLEVTSVRGNRAVPVLWTTAALCWRGRTCAPYPSIAHHTYRCWELRENLTIYDAASRAAAGRPGDRRRSTGRGARSAAASKCSNPVADRPPMAVPCCA
jgi:hypothetical protein